MGAFWDTIKAELDRTGFDISDRKLALKLGTSPSTIGNWRRGLKELPSRKNMESVATFVNQTYEEILLLALSETGYGQGTRLDRDAARRARLEPDDQT